MKKTSNQAVGACSLVCNMYCIIWQLKLNYSGTNNNEKTRNQAVGACSLVARIGGVFALLLDNLKVFHLSDFETFSTNLKPCANLIKKVFWLPAPVFIMGVVATGKSSHLSKPKSQEQRDFLRSSLTKKKTIGLFAEWPIIKLLNKKQTSPCIKLSKLDCYLHSGI